MAAHSLPTLELTLELEQEPNRSLRVNRNFCRFCGCTGGCQIPVTKDSAGNYILAFDDQATVRIERCNWYLPGVCSNPTCVQLLIQESHEQARVLRRRNG